MNIHMFNGWCMAYTCIAIYIKRITWAWISVFLVSCFALVIIIIRCSSAGWLAGWLAWKLRPSWEKQKSENKLCFFLILFYLNSVSIIFVVCCCHAVAPYALIAHIWSLYCIQISIGYMRKIRALEFKEFKSESVSKEKDRGKK